MRVVRDDDDTTRGDRPDRFVETARAEGFFVVARFDTQDEEGRAETMWVMNEPQSGILLTLATTEEEVLDASIHYNRRTDEAGMRRTPFPEHRHAESQTIYVRETCVDALRAACRRLRATKALVREWKVTPAITFLTPGEWLTIGNSGTVDPRGAVRALNSTRIAAIPEEVRAQFGLSVGETTPQTTPQ